MFVTCKLPVRVPLLMMSLPLRFSCGLTAIANLVSMTTLLSYVYVLHCASEKAKLRGRCSKPNGMKCINTCGNSVVLAKTKRLARSCIFPMQPNYYSRQAFLFI